MQKQINLIKKQIELLTQKILWLLEHQTPVSKKNMGLWIYNVACSHLGMDMAKYENKLGCAEAVNEIVRRAIGKPIGGGSSTNKMFNALKKSDVFKRVYEPLEKAQRGDIIISPTGYGLSNGHVGICGDDKIMSNNSKTFLWDDHITKKDWIKEYKEKRNFPVLCYRHI